MKKFWEFKAAKKEKTGELLLYGYISNSSWWGDEVTPKEFAKDLKGLGDIETLNLYINSGGGDVFAAQAIYSQLTRHSAKKHVYVDGLAASAASLIAMVGDTVTMPKNAMLMIHNPWTMGVGFASDLRKMADGLDKIRESMIPTYSNKSGLSHDEIIAIMDAETWLTAEEAKEKGFADEVEEAREIAACLRDGQVIINGQAIDISRFSNFPTDRIPVEQEPAEDKAEQERQARLRRLRLRARL